ncbi:MAG: molybdopterin-dependent oxidoreductase [Bacteroidetes bacterium]|nr:molybdopterin-dependent oxidoreductase [Bacteroidota bacterium]
MAHRCAHGSVSIKFDEKTGDWDRSGIPCYYQPDFANSEFVIFFGANPYEANYGPTNLAERLTEGLVSGRLKWAVVDPRMTKTAARAWKWVPVKPGADGALIMGMMRWIIENKRFDERFLRNANRGAAQADDELGWSNAAWLVKIDADGPAALLRGGEIGQGDKSTFVAVRGGKPVPFKAYDDKNPAEGDLLFDGNIGGFRVKTAFQIMRDEVFSHSLEEWAAIADVNPEDIIELSREFTAHGKKGVAESHRGLLSGTNDFHNTLGVITLNLLNGNYHWKGGIVKGGKWSETGDEAGQPYPVLGLHPNKLTSFGIDMGRHGYWVVFYDNSTLFEGYPAKRPWYPFQTLGGYWQEVLPSCAAKYPYPLKALWMYMGTPIQSVPAAQCQLDVYANPEKMPLVWATDPVLSEAASYADYLFPDTTYLERFDPYHPPTAAIPQEYNPVRQPVITPLTETVKVFGEEQHLSMEAVALAIAEKLGMQGYGKDGFGPGKDFNRAEDMYLKMVANIAWGHNDKNNVPDASQEELRLFQTARRHLAPTLFQYDRWRKAVSPELWPKVAYVLNRGGRWEHFDEAWKGEHYAHPWPHTILLYNEPMRLATRDSMTGKRFAAWAIYRPPEDAIGREIVDSEYPFYLITYKMVSRTNWRLDEHYWSMGITAENTIDLNRGDAERLGLKDGDLVKLVSASNPEGTWDLKNGEKRPTAARLRVIEGIRPGVVAVAASFGHWFYGARDVQVDGQVVKGDSRRGTGLNPNAVMRTDPYLKDICSTDHGQGQAAYLTKVNLVKV